MAGFTDGIYARRIGRPRTADEERGYWLFVAGLVLGVLGMLLFLPSAPASGLRQWSIALGGAGLALLIAGPVVRLPLRSLATTLTSLGLAVCAAALVWFLVAFPADWSVRTGNRRIISLYAAGVGIIGVGGVLIPLLTEATAAVDERSAELEAELAAEREGRERAERERDESREAGERDADAAAEERERLAAELAALRESQGRFELYEDAGGKWRWRLRHRNGNVIASSGQGYTRKHNAQKGLHGVRRDALGATVMLVEREADLPEAGESFTPVEERSSRAAFEVVEGRDGRHRWRLVHDNGNVIADSGQGYASASNARRALDRVREHAGPADYLWFDPAGFEVYRDRGGEYRWRLVHRNGNVLADSGEGYSRRHDARRAVDRLRERIDEFEFEVYEDAAGEHRWRLRTDGGDVLGDSGGGVRLPGRRRGGRRAGRAPRPRGRHAGDGAGGVRDLRGQGRRAPLAAPPPERERPRRLGRGVRLPERRPRRGRERQAQRPERGGRIGRGVRAGTGRPGDGP